MSQYEPDESKYRPAADERWIDGMRTEPVTFSVRTEWLYSQYDPRAIVPVGRTRHAFSRGGSVVSSVVPSPYEHQQSIVDHLHRAVAAFGDDKDLVIEVRLVDDKTEDLSEHQSSTPR